MRTISPDVYIVVVATPGNGCSPFSRAPNNRTIVDVNTALRIGWGKLSELFAADANDRQPERFGSVWDPNRLVDGHTEWTGGAARKSIFMVIMGMSIVLTRNRIIIVAYEYIWVEVIWIHGWRNETDYFFQQTFYKEDTSIRLRTQWDYRSVPFIMVNWHSSRRRTPRR